MRRVNITLLQLLIQPVHIKAHAFQIILQYPAIHDKLRKQQLLFRRQIHVVWRGRTLAAHRKDGELPVVFKYSGLDVRQVKVALLPSHDHELAQIQLGLFQIFTVQLPAVHEYGGRTVEVFARSWKFVGNDAQHR